MLSEAFIPVVNNSAELGLVLLLVFTFLWIQMAIGFAASVLKDPGPVPPWMQLETIEAFVEQEVQSILDQRIDDPHAQGGSQKPQNSVIRVVGTSTLPVQKKLSIANSSAPEGERTEVGNNVGEAVDHAVRANSMMFTAQTQRMQQDNRHGAGFTRMAGLSTNDNDRSGGSGGGFDLFAEDDQLLEDQRSGTVTSKYEHSTHRRRRRLQHDLRVLTFSRVARNALDALRSDPEMKAREMSLLLNYSFPCKICSVYQIMGTQHCDSCKRCISHKDIHFRWIGQCVGSGNHKYFVLFLLYLALLLMVTCVITFYAVGKGYTSFVVDDELQVLFLFCTLFAATYATAIPIFLRAHLHAVGCGDSTLSRIRRANRESVERFARRITPNGHYRPLFEDEPETPPGAFTWDRLRTAVFGIGPWWEWFLPSLSPKQASEEERESLFWVALGETVEQQLRSVAEAFRHRNAGNGKEEISIVGAPPGLHDESVVPAEMDSTHVATAGDPPETPKMKEAVVDVGSTMATDGVSADSGRRVPFFRKAFPTLSQFSGSNARDAIVQPSPPLDSVNSICSDAVCTDKPPPRTDSVSLQSAIVDSERNRNTNGA
ncbi:unnamed protein product [Phytomonas sp. EM1]|nr:unnamed protein product [Phytomonas sp. EM1]|eukprot:CCW61882.1 unnamed protein product [Phytomonas sp. isolate EM1]